MLGAVKAPLHQIRAQHTDDTITLYQAYDPAIGVPAARQGRFPPSWKKDRMTWVKPSFLWMMYRCGWGRKDNQETVLAVEITREGFTWALRNACLSHFHPKVHPDRRTWRERLRRSPARVQWDPERNLHLAPLDHRSLQLGLSGQAAHHYAQEWIVSITDVTPLVHRVHHLVQEGDTDAATRLLPNETPYPLTPGTLDHLCPPP